MTERHAHPQSYHAAAFPAYLVYLEAVAQATATATSKEALKKAIADAEQTYTDTVEQAWKAINDARAAQALRPEEGRAVSPSVGGRTDRVLALAVTGRYKTQTAIANEVGVSRQRVHQVLKKGNVRLNTRLKRRPELYVCSTCGGRKSRNYLAVRCRACAMKLRILQTPRLLIACKVCGKTKVYLRSTVETAWRNHGKQVGRFCSNRCKGVNMGMQSKGRPKKDKA